MLEKEGQTAVGGGLHLSRRGLGGRPGLTWAVLIHEEWQDRL